MYRLFAEFISKKTCFLFKIQSCLLKTKWLEFSLRNWRILLEVPQSEIFKLWRFTCSLYSSCIQYCIPYSHYCMLIKQVSEKKITLLPIPPSSWNPLLVTCSCNAEKTEKMKFVQQKLLFFTIQVQHFFGLLISESLLMIGYGDLGLPEVVKYRKRFQPVVISHW